MYRLETGNRPPGPLGVVGMGLLFTVMDDAAASCKGECHVGVGWLSAASGCRKGDASEGPEHNPPQPTTLYQTCICT